MTIRSRPASLAAYIAWSTGSMSSSGVSTAGPGNVTAQAHAHAGAADLDRRGPHHAPDAFADRAYVVVPGPGKDNQELLTTGPHEDVALRHTSRRRRLSLGRDKPMGQSLVDVDQRATKVRVARPAFGRQLDDLAKATDADSYV